jgi:hypothetical protein
VVRRGLPEQRAHDTASNGIDSRRLLDMAKTRERMTLNLGCWLLAVGF